MPAQHILLGEENGGTTADFQGTDQAAWKWTPGESADIIGYAFATKVANAEETKVQIGLYTDGGTDPSSLIAGTTADMINPTSTGLYYVRLATPYTLTAGTAVWIAWGHANAATWDWQGRAGSYKFKTSAVAGTLDSSWGTSAGTGSVVPTLYAVGQGGGGHFSCGVWGSCVPIGL